MLRGTVSLINMYKIYSKHSHSASTKWSKTGTNKQYIQCILSQVTNIQDQTLGWVKKKKKKKVDLLQFSNAQKL